MTASAEPAAWAGSRLLTRVVLRNYKSFTACDVAPAQLSFLVGANGSGKSNFLDALRFVADSLHNSVDHALRERGGINEVRRRSGGHPTHFGIRLEFELPGGSGHYAFKVGAKKAGGYEIQKEECSFHAGSKGRPAPIAPQVVTQDLIQQDVDSDGETTRAAVAEPSSEPSGLGGKDCFYQVESGRVVASSLASPPVAAADRLYLVNVSGIPAFRPVYDALSSMRFYNLSPAAMRSTQQPDASNLLVRDGSNVGNVLANLKVRAPAFKKRIDEYLSQIVPGVVGVDWRRTGPMESLVFRQKVRGTEHRFYANNMSDGTLRALGILAALFQSTVNDDRSPRLVGVEEPELALHPAGAGVLIDSLRDAALYAQVLVTSHSPDLLDFDDIPAESIFAVMAKDGQSCIAPLERVGRQALQDRLFSPGELLRMDQLEPDPAKSNPKPSQLDLFHAGN